jgi:hypothetical protein
LSTVPSNPGSGEARFRAFVKVDYWFIVTAKCRTLAFLHKYQP